MRKHMKSFKRNMKAGLQCDNARVAMHQDLVHRPRKDAQDFGSPGRIILGDQYVAQRHDDLGRRVAICRCGQKRFQLEAQGPSRERITLQQQQIGLHTLEQGQQRIPATSLERIIRRRSLIRQQSAKMRGIGGQGRQAVNIGPSPILSLHGNSATRDMNGQP